MTIIIPDPELTLVEAVQASACIRTIMKTKPACKDDAVLIQTIEKLEAAAQEAAVANPDEWERARAQIVDLPELLDG
jgi:hypothetical protein